ncbi:hypothetical protein Bca101_066896 [Brassica carinata]
MSGELFIADFQAVCVGKQALIPLAATTTQASYRLLGLLIQVSTNIRQEHTNT